MNVLQIALGVKEKDLAKLKEWNQTRSVTLAFKAEETCKFLRKVEREVKSDTTRVTETTVFGNFKNYTVTKVTEWFWQFDVRGNVGWSPPTLPPLCLPRSYPRRLRTPCMLTKAPT